MSLLIRLAMSGLIFFAVGYLFTHQLTERQFNANSDESYYFQYAQTIDHHGLNGLQGLLFWFEHDPKAKLHPPPLRVAYILLSAFLFKLFGSSFFVLRVFSTFCFIAFLILNFYYIRKFFDLDTALCASVFLSSSPLLLAMARRALIDSPLNLLWGACVWLLFDFIFEGDIKKFVILIFTFTLSLLFKETSLVLLPFFVLALLIFLPKNKYPLWLLTALLCIVPLVLSAELSIFLVGGWGVACKAVQASWYVYKHISEFNPYVAKYCEGPWYRYILDFIVLTPLVSLLAFGYSFSYLLSGFQDKKKNFFLLYGVSLYVILNLFQNNQNVRFAVNLEMIMSLLAVFGLQSICKLKEIFSQCSCFFMGAGIIFCMNIINFIHIFVRGNNLDPISYRLLSAVHIIP